MTTNKESNENIVSQTVIGMVLLLCLTIGGIIMAVSYSTKAIEREAKTIEYFQAGKVIVCKPEITPISNKDWKYEPELRSFTKGVKIFTAVNCQLRK